MGPGSTFVSSGSSGSATAGAMGGRWSVRRYLALIAVTALLALAAASWYGFSWSSSRARSVAVSQMKSQATRAAESITSSVANGKDTVSSLAAQPGLAAVFAHPVKGCTLSATGSGPFPDLRLDIVAADGQVGCSSSKSAAVFAPDVHRGSAWLAAAMAAPSTTVVWDARDGVTQQRSVVVSAPVRTADGKVAGAIALFMHIAPNGTGLAHDFANGGQPSFTVVDETSRGVLSTSLGGSRAAGYLGRAFPGTHPLGEWTNLDGSRAVFASQAVAGSTWRVYVATPTAQVFAAARGSLLRGGLVGLVCIGFLAVALVLLDRRVAGPLRAVTTAVVAARRDPDAPRVSPEGTSELVTLANEVNAMLDVRAGHDAQLKHQATHDPLTGVPNNILFRDRLDQALRRDRGGADLAVLSLGIDRFRTLNDALGPDAADRILVELSDRLTTALRAGDTLARIGGDQFVVLCEDIEDADHAVRVAARLRSCVDEAFHPTTEPVAVSCSVGISIVHGHQEPPTSARLLREADSAMHQAKKSGAGWSLADQSQQNRASQHLETERALRQALEGEQFVVHYQPLFNIATGRVAGAEALVRWQHPDRGLVPPMEFVPVAEETGQIDAIGAFVLTQACAEASRWAAAGSPLRVSVNVAVGQLRDPGFVAAVRHALAVADLPAGKLCLEVTESAMMRATGPESKTLEALRELGVRLAIDDFGTGYSSLAYLHQLPVDELKIDRSFVNRMAPGNRDAHLVEAILGMARALELDVVAEGVETPDQLEFLAGLDCQQAQGYLFSPPVPAATFRAQHIARPRAAVRVEAQGRAHSRA